MNQALEAILAKVRRELAEAETQLADPAVLADPRRLAESSRRYGELRSTVDLGNRVEAQSGEVAELEAALAQPDPELVALAEGEIADARGQLTNLERKLAAQLTPPDPADARGVVVEIRAGTGGDEAALFAGELARLYTRFAERRGWKTGVVSQSGTSLGGVKELILEIDGDGVFRALKYESGVHRVQRVPTTEKSGRIHTSTATVAVLPQAEEADVRLKPEELKIEATTASGHGGQSVNTTYSAIRITHLPTGLVVVCQDERSQAQNKEKALMVLRARLLEAERQRLAQERSDLRRGQVGTGDRSEKVRTYNFPQDRCTDHRLGLTVHNLSSLMDGDLDRMVEALQAKAAGLETGGEEEDDG